ncbi:hypothetical protein J4218_02210 [Candidatus Pacearchaeota archaeon]|nr:hypothetical protein [uncultured archaeon]MBS3078912.1 hypothetical protein [Candidatus Pacearchaeota archaeon]
MVIIKNKKGAIELSMSTIVVLVLAMSMLILGLVLVKSIFTGAKYNVDQMNEKVKAEIGKLFAEDQMTVVYLPDHLAKAKKGEQIGVAFGWSNVEKGTTEAPKFKYTVTVDQATLKTACSGLSKTEIEKSWIRLGSSSDPRPLNPGNKDYGLVRFQIPSDAPLCIIRFNLEVSKGNAHYASDFFDLEITT